MFICKRLSAGHNLTDALRLVQSDVMLMSPKRLKAMQITNTTLYLFVSTLSFHATAKNSTTN